MLAQIHPAQRYLFPHASDPWKRMSENTLNFALKRLGYKDHLTGHGIRATISTALNEIGYPKVWVDAQLSHADPDKVSSAYNHAAYVEQRSRMMQDWADRLDLFEQNRVEEASRHLAGNREGVSAGGEVEGGWAVSGEIPAPARSAVERGREPLAAQGSMLRLLAVVLSRAGLQPELSDLQRERMEMLQIYDSPHMLPAADFANGRTS